MNGQHLGTAQTDEPENGKVQATALQDVLCPVDDNTAVGSTLQPTAWRQTVSSQRCAMSAKADATYEAVHKMIRTIHSPDLIREVASPWSTLSANWSKNIISGNRIQQRRSLLQLIKSTVPVAYTKTERVPSVGAQIRIFLDHSTEETRLCDWLTSA